MNLRLYRFHHSKNDTLGLLFIDGVFTCFTLEDEHREVKVAGETRIPEGTYFVELRDYGTHAKRYGHPMLEIKGVPGFTDILIHKGNTEKDTAGCLLVGDAAHYNPLGDSSIGSSTVAYDRIYPIISQACKDGIVTIEVTNDNQPRGLSEIISLA